MRIMLSAIGFRRTAPGQGAEADPFHRRHTAVSHGIPSGTPPRWRRPPWNLHGWPFGLWDASRLPTST